MEENGWTYLGTVDKGCSHLSLGEHGRCLDIIPVFTGEGIHTEIIKLHVTITYKTYQVYTLLKLCNLALFDFHIFTELDII